MTKIAIITGATGGIGKEFVKQISVREDIDEIWAVGRNEDKLAALCSEYKKAVPVQADLTDGGVEVIQTGLNESKPDVRLLVNNAGIAYMGMFGDMNTQQIDKFVQINCSAPAKLMNVVLPFMTEGAGIINLSSASSFQPNPYLAMYSASKIYLKNLSRAVNIELKSRGITVTSSCPGWVDTELLPRTKDGQTIKYTGMISAEKVVTRALKDNAKGKDMSVPGFFAKYFRFYSKVTPTYIVMNMWSKSVRKYV